MDKRRCARPVPWERRNLDLPAVHESTTLNGIPGSPRTGVFGSRGRGRLTKKNSVSPSKKGDPIAIGKIVPRSRATLRASKCPGTVASQCKANSRPKRIRSRRVRGQSLSGNGNKRWNGRSAWSLTHKQSQRSLREMNDTFRLALALALKWEPGTCQGLNQHWAQPSGATHPGSGLGCPVLSSALAPPLSSAIFGLEVGREGESRREGSSGHSACAERSRPRHHRGFPRSFQASKLPTPVRARQLQLHTEYCQRRLERYKTQVITKYYSSAPANASWVRRATDGRTA